MASSCGQLPAFADEVPGAWGTSPRSLAHYSLTVLWWPYATRRWQTGN